MSSHDASALSRYSRHSDELGRYSRPACSVCRSEIFATREWFFGAPGGETFEDVAARAGAWLADLPAEPERRVIAVSHGVTGRLVRGAYAGLGRQATLDQDVPQDALYRLQNGQIDRLDCEPVV